MESIPDSEPSEFDREDEDVEGCIFLGLGSASVTDRVGETLEEREDLDHLII